MEEHELTSILETQRRFFASGVTRDPAFRKRALLDLRAAILDHEQALYDALEADLGKHQTESYLSELFVVMREIRVSVRGVKRWSKRRSPGLPAYLWLGKGHVVPEPYGVALIIAPWNFPFQLAMAPVVGALAAGNCCVLKPSELTPHTAEVMRDIAAAAFAPELATVVLGGIEESQQLLARKFDRIFFTGSPAVGRIVAAAAAQHLTPTTLELGGKNPCVVARDARLDRAVPRIALGKYLNAGQACVSPDYALVDRTILDDFIAEVKRCLERMYGPDPEQSPDYCRIVNRRHFDRLRALLDEGRIAYGGETDEEQLYIAPTGIVDVPLDGKLMADEIFGPVLPIIPFDSVSEAAELIGSKPEPLSLYLFSKDRAVQEEIGRSTASGSYCINEAVVHFTADTLPFGGVGESGVGKYHGESSFEAFSHMRAVVKRGWSPDLPLRYPPYAKRQRWLALLKRFFT
jgi:acyl-CoA reductase-like NAD-dependent aldehyde dehydrogenase